MKTIKGTRGYYIAEITSDLEAGPFRVTVRDDLPTNQRAMGTLILDTSFNSIKEAKVAVTAAIAKDSGQPGEAIDRDISWSS